VIDWPIAELLPHAGAMILLDAVVAFEAESILCQRHVSPGGLFQESDGALPAWVGVELMAQAIAAWAGCQARQQQRAVQLGLLLGTRHYHCNVPRFAVGTTMAVSAQRNFHDAQGMGVFDCRIEAPGIEAQARLTVFSPPDMAAFFAGQSKETHA
jgi:predicted hotdog family 3-hydroxylacyl-ACP dehydratase